MIKYDQSRKIEAFILAFVTSFMAKLLRWQLVSTGYYHFAPKPKWPMHERPKIFWSAPNILHGRPKYLS